MKKVIGTLVTGAALAILPAGAAAGSVGGESMHFSLPASNGYTLQVKTEGELAKVSLWRSNPVDHASDPASVSRAAGFGTTLVATYYVSDAASPGAIDADLGALGSIHVNFTPSGQTRTVRLDRRPMPAGCRAPRRLVRRLGRFEGTISFHGEDGFAEVEAVGAAGAAGPSARRLCGSAGAVRSRAGAPDLPGVERVWVLSDVFLFARNPSTREKPNATWFLAWTTGVGVRYLAWRFEVVSPGLAIERTATVAGLKAGFSHSGDLSSATLRPPSPFSGEASFSERSGRLSGDLAVELPGSAPEPLTGRAFEARIVATR
jgi:hypothetical protein